MGPRVTACWFDAGYGVDTAFRQALSDMGLEYALGVTAARSSSGRPASSLCLPSLTSGKGRPPVMLQAHRRGC